MSMSQKRQQFLQINAGFTLAERDAIDAARGTRSRAAFLRHAGLAAAGAAEQPRQTRRGRPSVDVDSVADLSENLGRLTGATIQLAKSLRIASAGQFHTQTEAVLVALRDGAANLATIIGRMQ